jgi:hypothetical protein
MIRHRLSCVVALVLAGAGASASAQVLVLGRVGGTGQLFTVDTSTGAASAIPGISGLPQITGMGSTGTSEVVVYRATQANSGRRINITTGTVTVLPNSGTTESAGGDCSPTSGLCWLSDNLNFARIDPATGAVTTLATPPEEMEGLAFAAIGAGGSVFGVGSSAGPGASLLYRYDIATDAWSAVGSVGFPVDEPGLAYDPAGDVIYMVQSSNVGSAVAGSLYTLNRTTGAATLVGATGFGTGADEYALAWVNVPPPSGVTVSDTTPVPVLFAQEIVASATAPVTLTNSGGALNLTSALGYSFTQGEVRYGRVECPAHVRFAAGSTVVASDDPASTIGAINGLPGNVITFSITADTTGLTATDSITVTGNRTITATTPATCAFSLYDNPSEAQAGGPTGRIVTRSGAYLSFGPSYTLVADPVFTVTASVEATPSYSRFVPSGDTTATRGVPGRLSFRLTNPVPRQINGTPITLATLMVGGANGTRVSVTGDFSMTANADGSYTGAALNRVFLSGGITCAAISRSAETLSATTATFDVGVLGFNNRNLCIDVNGTPDIRATSFASTLRPVAASAAYAVTDIGPLPTGSIVRDGTELQAPMAQVPTGYVSRVALTNTGTIARAFTWRFLAASGGSASEANTATSGATTGSGTIPANSVAVLALNDLLGGFGSTPPRGTFVVAAAAPSGQIQGLYQIVDPARATISNHVMVRPATN